MPRLPACYDEVLRTLAQKRIWRVALASHCPGHTYEFKVQRKKARIKPAAEQSDREDIADYIVQLVMKAEERKSSALAVD